MSAYALILWTTIAVANMGTPTQDWREVTRFESTNAIITLAMCERAKRELDVKDRARCIQVK